MISRNYSLDLALSTQRESIRSSSALLHKSLQQRQLEEDKKKKDKKGDEDDDKDGTMGFQQPAHRVNMIYGGDSFFNKRN